MLKRLLGKPKPEANPLETLEKLTEVNLYICPCVCICMYVCMHACVCVELLIMFLNTVKMIFDVNVCELCTIECFNYKSDEHVDRHDMLRS